MHHQHLDGAGRAGHRRGALRSGKVPSGRMAAAQTKAGIRTSCARRAGTIMPGEQL